MSLPLIYRCLPKHGYSKFANELSSHMYNYLANTMEDKCTFFFSFQQQFKNAICKHVTQIAPSINDDDIVKTDFIDEFMEIPIHVKLEIKSYIIRKDRSKASIEFQSKQRYDSETNTLECSIAMHEHKIHGFYIDESLQTDVKKGLMDLIYGDCQVNHNFNDIALLLYPEAKIMNYIHNITNKIINYNGFVSQNVNIANLFKDIYTNSHFYLALEVLNDRLEDLNKNEQIELKKYIKHYIYLAIINWANAIFKWKDWYLDNYQKEFTQKVYNQVFKSVFQEETI